MLLRVPLQECDACRWRHEGRSLVEHPLGPVEDCPICLNDHLNDCELDQWETP